MTSGRGTALREAPVLDRRRISGAMTGHADPRPLTTPAIHPVRKFLTGKSEIAPFPLCA